MLQAAGRGHVNHIHTQAWLVGGKRGQMSSTPSPPNMCLYLRIVSLATELKKGGKKKEIFSQRIYGWCKDRKQWKT